MKTALTAVAAAAVSVLISAAVALAQSGLMVSDSTSVDVGSAYAQVMQPVLMAIGSAAAVVITAAAGYAVQWLRKKTGIQELELDAQHRDALQAAITNAAGLAINKLGNDLKGKTIDVGNPAVKEAVDYVVRSAPDAIKHFDLDKRANDIAEKIVAKLPQIANAGQAS